jgi:tetratricopeptide (TPR) repeat protein
MASLASDGISHEEMNSLKLCSPQSRYNPFYAFARSRALRLAVKCLQFGLTVVAMAGLLAPMNLAAHRRKSSSPDTVANPQAPVPSALERSYRQRADSNPQDVEAFEGMAILQVRRGAYEQAIESYRRVLDIAPHDHDALIGLGRALAFDGQYNSALRNFQGLLRERPDDTDALEGIARVQMWSGKPSAALSIFQNLAAHYPANPEYALGAARAEMTLHQYPTARKTLLALLSTDPHNRDVQKQLAYLDLYEGHQTAALRRFNHLISQEPTDPEALLGNARIAYYRGDNVYARNLAKKIVDDNGRDVSAILLLAQTERALHHKRQAHALVDRAEALEPDNGEARQLEQSLNSDSRPTLHTSSSFAREATSGSPSNAENLSTFGEESTWGFFKLPQSESFFSLSYLPSRSTSGGIQGSVEPAQIFYRQTYYLAPQLTLRGGIGLVRFGSGDLAGIPTQDQPINSAGIRPAGFAGLSYALKKKRTVDFTFAHAAITYTPASVHLGVMEDRLSIGWNYRFGAKTSLGIEPYVNEDSTFAYNHMIGLAGSGAAQFKKADRTRGAGASIIFDRNLFHRSGIAVDIGYDGLAYGFAGGGLKPYLGFFNPGFYQRHYLTTHLVGKIRGPLGYDFSSGAGVQQVERGTAIKPALLLSPAFTLRASARLLLTVGYTHYDSSQALGTLRGDAMRLSTDWKF